MATKNQANCYRTINGHQYINWGDILSPEDEASIVACKENNIPHRVFKHPDGFRRLFVRKDVMVKLVAEGKLPPGL